jgi:hypothetical protein
MSPVPMPAQPWTHLKRVSTLYSDCGIRNQVRMVDVRELTIISFKFVI